jgi:activating signal cointegrator 1
VKILSIRQPWAYLITQRSENIENRSWPTKYRGPFLVHASLNIDKQGCLDHEPITSSKAGGLMGNRQRRF